MSHTYVCSSCSATLELERVVSIELVQPARSASRPSLVIEHWCDCSDERLLAKYTPSRQLLAGLIGEFSSNPLPYRSPFNYRKVSDDDPALVAWRWELSQVGDVAEFLLFLGVRPEQE